jgi:hypothetical protein
MLYKGNSLCLAICACYSWEIAINIGLDASFIDMQGSKGLWEKVGEINGMKVYLLNDEIFLFNSQWLLHTGEKGGGGVHTHTHTCI